MEAWNNTRRGAVIATLAVSLSALVAGAAGAQTQGTPSGAAAQGNSAISSRVRVTTSTSLSPIVARAQDMLRVARARQMNAPSGARQSYKASAQALNHMLSTAGYGSSASSALPASGMRSRASASLSTLPITSEQITEDIHMLRWMAQQGSRSGSALSKSDMQQVASLYATGAKEFFTGQIREALFQSPVSVARRSSAPIRDEMPNTGAVAARGSRSTVPFPITLQHPDSNQGGNVSPGIVPAGDPSVVPSVSSPIDNGSAPVPPLPNQGPYAAPVAPNVQFAPSVNYGGYLYGPSAIILGGYAPTAGFNGTYPYVPFF